MKIHRFQIAIIKGDEKPGQPVQIKPEAVLMIPPGAKPMSLGLGSKGINIFAAVDPAAEPEPREVRMVPTGGDMPEGFDYIGSITPPSAPALHVFIETEAK